MRNILICAFLVLPVAAYAGNKQDHTKSGQHKAGTKMERSIGTMTDDTPGEGSTPPGDGDVPVVIDHNIIGGRLVGKPIDITPGEGPGDGGMLVSIREIEHHEFHSDGGDSGNDDDVVVGLPTDPCEGGCNAFDPLPEEE